MASNYSNSEPTDANECESTCTIQLNSPEQINIESQDLNIKSNLLPDPTENEFELLGIQGDLLKGVEGMGWEIPTYIQREAIPHILDGKDVTIASETGSGKTGSFALPILTQLQNNPKSFYALVLEPTRELADQVAEQFKSLGLHIGTTVCSVVGQTDRSAQVIELGKQPQIIVATPGRIHDVLKNSAIKLNSLKVLVLDEADKMLQMNFEDDLNFLLKKLRRDIQRILVSATLSKSVSRLQKLSLKDPVVLHFDWKMPEGLKHFYLKCPLLDRESYLVALVDHLVSKKQKKKLLVFTNVCTRSLQVAFMLHELGFNCVAINGKLAQKKRNEVLEAFQNFQGVAIMVATDVASRGIDFSDINVVINYDLPFHHADYTHRAGRTARAGKSGIVISMVHQYNVQHYLKIETLLLRGEKQPEYPCSVKHKAVINTWAAKVSEAKNKANKRVSSIMKVLNKNEEMKKKRRKTSGGVFDMETEEGTVVQNKVVKKQRKH